jgi:hypothetical protein
LGWNALWQNKRKNQESKGEEMTKEKRLKRIEELKEKITGIMQRGRVYKNRKGITLNKASLNTLKQYQKAIEIHELKL